MKQLGDGFEGRAIQYLEERGLQVLQRNFRAKTGEIDIIALAGECLVFVEVRSRSNTRFGGAAITVDWRKQRKILRTAALFLQCHPGLAQLACRFDVVAFEPPQSSGEDKVRWIRSAFSA
jgi:putative endonuclease